MDKHAVARVLGSMADLLELDSENPFRSRSYRSAARALEASTEDLAALAAAGNLSRVKGVGETIAGDIEQILATGTSERLEELHRKVPPGVREMLEVPGLGPKKIRALWKTLGLETLDALRAACESGAVAELSGFGQKTAEKIVAGIEYLRSVSGQTLYSEAEMLAAAVLEVIRGNPGVERAEVAGSLRRRKEVVRDLDFVASSTDPGGLSACFASLPGVVEVIAQGPTKTSVRFESGIAADLRVVEDEVFAATLCHFTGSKEHNTALRARAKARGLKLNEYGLYREEERLETPDESSIHAALGLSFIEPELRENLGEIERAEAGELPRLVADADLRGVLHLHTTWSDGKASLRDMAEAARARGYEYIGVTDHSQTAVYAGGLKPKDVLAQHREIDDLNAEYAGAFRIFKGTESDLLPDGSLDYDRETLARFDFVIASLHASLTQDEPTTTARVVRALENPFTTMLGHVTARLLLRREPARLDMDRVLETAAERGVVVEINANPWRLELDWRHGPRARELGLRTSINPDAHAVGGIDDMRYGVGIARKAGFEPDRVLNTRTAAELAAFLEERRARALA